MYMIDLNDNDKFYDVHETPKAIIKYLNACSDSIQNPYEPVFVNTTTKIFKLIITQGFIVTDGAVLIKLNDSNVETALTFFLLGLKLGG